VKLGYICQAGTDRQRCELMNNVVECLTKRFAEITLSRGDDSEPQSAFRATHYQIQVSGSRINEHHSNSFKFSQNCGGCTQPFEFVRPDGVRDIGRSELIRLSYRLLTYVQLAMNS
jgi:hypothetical protein